MRAVSLLGVLALTLATLGPSTIRAADRDERAGVPAKYRPMINKAFDWLIKQQNERDGSFSTNGQYPITMTALAGMAMLMEGSTTKEGKFAKRIAKARDFLMSRAQPNGLIGNPNIPGEAGRYMYGHGFALLFLSCVYGEETNKQKREKLEEILTKAAKYCRDAQTNRGGWGYISAKDGQNFDEGSVTITQVQALRAARNAGIKVPLEAIKDAQKYLEQSTGSDGGVCYSLAYGGGGGGRPALTAAAICCGFSSGDYNSPLVKKWFKFCQSRIPLLSGNRFGHDEYTHYYYAQSIYMLGNDGWAKLFPNDKESDRITWKKYREHTFEFLKNSQSADGSWHGSQVGPIFATPVYLTILQLDNNTLAIYQR